jgi:hypothetical protein
MELRFSGVTGDLYMQSKKLTWGGGGEKLLCGLRARWEYDIQTGVREFCCK